MLRQRAALIVDNLQIRKWQKNALDLAEDQVEIVLVINCKNTKTKRKILNNFFYYILNFVSLRNRLTKREAVDYSDAKLINFYSIHDGSWQELPTELLSCIKDEGIEIIIKFGMGLLRVNEQKSTPPILSYHHGDPSRYRGRPAGFYEILNREKTIGIIVQRLSNEIDAGSVLAFAESQVFNYSYKKTMVYLYKTSEVLLRKAVINIVNRTYIKRAGLGRVYRLPSNFLVARFILKIVQYFILRIAYALFFEKQWRVCFYQESLNLSGNEVISLARTKGVPMLGGYSFYADPFFSKDGKRVRLEALGTDTGVGDILEIDINDMSNQVILLSGRHYSYPSSFVYSEREFLLPEVAAHSDQVIYDVGSPSKEMSFIRGLEGRRIVDATMLFVGRTWYLFFGDQETSLTILNLWYSDSPFGEFKEHPMSPIVVSPRNARMAGPLVYHLGRLLRFGQNSTGGYGGSLCVMEVLILSEVAYQEKQVGTVTMEGLRGPHTIGFSSEVGPYVLDYYRERFSLFAGVRRIKAMFKSRS